ncbi:MAG TPA: SDR family NAD(P)-dependent oxidoreductase [Bacteroidales bacterium]|nr:SDR family NAD(P)-dependent oxidoreductase [Bacteroidales bacterium]HPI85596.1 SDR family NAD(P)-dependent oxidoreductase [Bacteroidales bacterium]HPM92760.1 SDR family NAD(P)-dependent oxidoreductase [Bacteroidales bacterium]
MPTILITGANGNLGLAVVSRLLDDGNRIIAVTGKSAAGILPHDKNLVIKELDLMDEEKAENLVRSALKDDSGIDAAVLLAGGFAMGKLTDTGKADLDKMINLNFYTAYNMVRPLLKHFLERGNGGQFILVGSRPGLDAATGKDFFAYSLSKALVFKLAEHINAAGKEKGVTATVIVPSTIDTEANRKAMPGADFSKWVPAEKIADAISFSLSETGKMIRESVVKIYNRS